MGQDMPSLLLLPAPPHPASRAALSAAYLPPLKAAISRLKDENEPNGCTLIVALVAPILQGHLPRQKSMSWPELQSVLAGIYSIIAVVCAHLHVPTHVGGGRGSVDARVILVDHDITKSLASDFKPAIEPSNTVIVDLSTFVSAYHPWKLIFNVNTESGHKLCSTYRGIVESIQPLKQDQLVTVDGGLTLQIGPETIQSSTSTSLYDVVCLGGTFDHLHTGHKLLLTAAALLLKVPGQDAPKPCTFVIGITGDELLRNKKYAEYVESWDDRAMNVIKFLSSMLELRKDGWENGHRFKLSKKDGEIVASFRDNTVSIQCVCIQDAFGPTITVREMDALVVSGETRSGGAAVNERRKELGWHALDVFEVDVLDAEEVPDEATKTENFASKISSTAIRKQKAESRI